MKISINRRLFLKTACMLGTAAAANAFFPYRSQSKPGASTPHRIDVHHHIVPPFYVSALAGIGIHVAGGAPFPKWSPQNSMAVMNRNGIATAITSISSPGVYFGDRTFSRDLARRCNEYSAALVYKYPKRFGAFAVLPLPDVHDALKELTYALDALKLDGVALLSNVGGRYLGNPEFDELFNELNRRDAVVHIHPTEPPGGIPFKLAFPAYLVEFVFDTTRAVANLIYSGTMERCPNIRFIASHAGGTAPYLAWRISLFQYQPGIQRKIPQGVVAYLKRFYYDTALSAAPSSLCSLQELIGPSHILFGSDYPFAPEPLMSATVSGLKAYDGFNDQGLQAIEQENALRLFSRLELRRRQESD